MVNKDFWNGLTPEQRIAIDEAAFETEAAVVNFAEDAAQAHFQLLAKEGVDMHLQTLDEREVWKAAFQSHVMKTVIEASSDPEGTRELIQSIRGLYP